MILGWIAAFVLIVLASGDWKPQNIYRTAAITGITYLLYRLCSRLFSRLNEISHSLQSLHNRITELQDDIEEKDPRRAIR
jgi:hypothetical protein